MIKTHPQNRQSSERGNALWFVLIALVLIGLLTAVVSRGGSSVDQTGDFEQMSIKASQMLRYIKGIEAAITNMKMQGIGENQISFYRDLNGDGDDATSPEAGEYYNPNCTSNECLVFHVEGGGISYQAPPAGMNDGSDWIYTGRLRVTGIGSNATTTGSELIMMLQNVNVEYCKVINKVLKVSNPSGNPPKDVNNSNPSPVYDGTFANGNQIDGDLTRISAACYDGFDSGSTPPEGTYQYYSVLLAR